MKKLFIVSELLDIFEFKTFRDSSGNELVVYKSSTSDALDGTYIEDKTAFEALDSHVHLFDNVKRQDVEKLLSLGSRLGKLLLERLSFCFPDKHFVVYVSVVVNDSMIIRFHQKWEDEPCYYEPGKQEDGARLIAFEN